MKRGRNLLGRDLIQKLGNNPSNDEHSHTEGKFPHQSIFSCQHMFVDTSILPSIKGMVHKVNIDKNVGYKHQKLRILPFGVRDLVSQELSRLESKGVIEKIDSSEWVSPIVVSHKKSGKVRICVELRGVNEAVIQLFIHFLSQKFFLYFLG